MMFKKTLLALALSVSAAALSTQAFAETLKVGTHPTFAPFEFSDQDGNVIGFDLDVIKAIAKANGDEIQIESMPFDGLIPSLLTGNIDVIISGMTITDARKKRVLFTDGYYDSNLSYLIKKDKADVYTSAEALKGKTVCVQIGTTGHAFADTITPGNVKALNNESDAILELSNGGCEAVINDRPVNLYYLKKSNLDTLVDVVDPKFKENVDSFGIAVRKGNNELLEKLNKGLKDLQASGELDKIHIKWFGQSSKEQAAEAPDAQEPAAEAPAAQDAAKEA
ncbi:basic amino acid ABC transporter substrate-binding protein [Anaerobiospirillum sp. NML120448]|uniref:basic amino acid ABC transporter substrate-binding protein n=1 Tax=Anaerobiospirillum sp. NML120448 TaxID=2932816 RepID=UPI001FF378DE|nr:basic amino acid ABC transporter substrate-binding protein [Anaerobiospirillum sp. NML120448]MCK0513416.1 basic amino acid ABC transporter substrate-binding protein [Anaerobiospirillum sp. NML120448]